MLLYNEMYTRTEVVLSQRSKRKIDCIIRSPNSNYVAVPWDVREKLVLSRSLVPCRIEVNTPE